MRSINQRRSKLKNIFGPLSKATVLLAGAFCLLWFSLVGKPMLDDVKRWNLPYIGCSSELVGPGIRNRAQIRNQYFYVRMRTDGSISLVDRGKQNDLIYPRGQYTEVDRNIFEFRFADPNKWLGEPNERRGYGLSVSTKQKGIFDRARVDFNEPSFSVWGADNLVYQATCFK